MNRREVLRGQGALFALVLVATCSLARCFVGPGELVTAIGAVVVAEAAVVGGTMLAPHHRSSATLIGLLGVLAVAIVPIWFVAGGATTWGWPTFSTFHTIGSDIGAAWTTFNQLRAPVPELKGFVLVCGWAAGGCTLLSGWAAAGGDTPVWVAAPPTALFMFTSALGTSQWRGVAIAAEVASLIWYAAATHSIHRLRGTRRALRVGADGAPVAEHRARDPFGPGPVVAGVVVTAALVAGLIGPRLPGAGDAALVSIHGHPSPEIVGGNINPPEGQVVVSPLVEVAQQEIFQSHLRLFTFRSSVNGYLVYATLDSFDGNVWTEDASKNFNMVSVIPNPSLDQGGSAAVATQDGTLPDELVTIQVQIDHLGGTTLPSFPVPYAEGGPGRDAGVYYPVQAMLSQDLPLAPGNTATIESIIPEVSANGQPIGADSSPIAPSKQDLEIPAGIPSTIVDIAHSAIKGATTAYQKALDLVNYFHSGSFTYSLPQVPPDQGAVATGGEGLTDLVNFLTSTRTGFCQQYSAAYALLARIDGLPTRVAVGFASGQPIGDDTYAVTGTDAHAWPQVYLGPRVGWWSFEPTPGASIPALPVAPASVTIGTGGGSTTTSTPSTSSTQVSPAGHHTGGPHGSSGNGQTAPATNRTHHGPAKPSAPPVGLIVLLVLVVGLGLAGPIVHALRRRRYHDPAGRILQAWWEAQSALEMSGLAMRHSETFSELARRAAHAGAVREELAADLLKLARDTEFAAYAPTVPPPEVVAEAVAASRRVASAAKRRAGTWKRLVATFDPR
ncbi:MAG TPA: transglutaminase-like domain-containing protein [Acidimicrobiales bacterium]|nr:transglutaminase-like domain-containing protein [Acidimicrobiales bacterium]